MRAEQDVFAGPRQLSMAWADDEKPTRLAPYIEGWGAIADELGMSENHVRLLGIPVYRLGSGKSARVRIDRADLVAWVEARKAQTTKPDGR